MILSNARTTNVLLAGKKTCTRRVWSDASKAGLPLPARTATAWISAYQGDRLLHSAWDKCSFVKGAKKIADIRLTQLPYQERLEDMPQPDLNAEGGLWASKEEFINLFGSPDTVVWVVRFELVMPIDNGSHFCNNFKTDNGSHLQNTSIFQSRQVFAEFSSSRNHAPVPKFCKTYKTDNGSHFCKSCKCDYFFSNPRRFATLAKVQIANSCLSDHESFATFNESVMRRNYSILFPDS